MKCETCETKMTTKLRGKAVCFDCQDKEIRKVGFYPQFATCIRHPGRAKYLLSEGCEKCTQLV